MRSQPDAIIPTIGESKDPIGDHMYEDVLASRYSGLQMSNLFSPVQRITIMREIWIALAETEKELGISISDEQINRLKATVGVIDFKRIDEIERETKHDVVAHIKAWGEAAGAEAAKIIHLGATSALVTDNADLIQQKRGLQIIQNRMVQLMRALAKFTIDHKNTKSLGYTHFQPAQPVTMGKRAAMWLQDIIIDFDRLSEGLDDVPALGAKGATGTQESFMELFHGDGDKVQELDTRFASKLGLNGTMLISGQTYTRKLDVHIADIIANIGISLHKMGTDFRLLAHTGELRESFSAKQVGSSAMPYKRNPMQAERMCSLAKLAINYREAIAHSTSVQWLERTLDDSAMRRVTIPDQFMAIDGALRVAISLVSKMTVDQDVVKKLYDEHVIYFTTEYIINLCVERGMDRLKAHEILRDLATMARGVLGSGSAADTFRRWVYEHSAFEQILKLDDVWKKDQDWTGRAASQVDTFMGVVNLILERHKLVPEFEDAISK
jgi:adenylosuccinate lyase